MLILAIARKFALRVAIGETLKTATSTLSKVFQNSGLLDPVT